MFTLKKREPDWLDMVPGVRVQFAPVTPKAARAAKLAARAVLLAGGSNDDAGDAFSCELIQRGIRDWEGIGDAQGVALAVTPDAIELFLEEPALFEAADAKYVLPWVAEDAEKNGLSLSQNGTSGAKTAVEPIAATAPKPVKNARTSSTSRKPRPAKTRGK